MRGGEEMRSAGHFSGLHCMALSPLVNGERLSLDRRQPAHNPHWYFLVGEPMRRASDSNI